MGPTLFVNISYNCSVGCGIFHMHVLISLEPWFVGMSLSLDPCIRKNQETGYPDLFPVRMFPEFKLRPTQSRDCSSWDWQSVKL